MNYDQISAKCYVGEDGVIRHKHARHSMPAGRPVSSSKQPSGHLALSTSVDGKVRCVSYARACWMLFNKRDIPSGMEIDHINRNPSDNHAGNLRLADRSQQLCNQKRPSVSGKTGVYRNSAGRFDVQICKHGRTYWGGTFNTLDSAVARRAELASALHGEFAT